jgi:hypothetical protein
MTELCCVCSLGCRARQIVQDVQAAGLQDRCTVFAPPLPIQFGTHHRWGGVAAS